MLHLSSTELSMIRVAIRTRIDSIKVGLYCQWLPNEDREELIDRYERLLSALNDFALTKSKDSRTVLAEVLNTPIHFLGHENREN